MIIHSDLQILYKILLLLVLTLSQNLEQVQAAGKARNYGGKAVIYGVVMSELVVTSELLQLPDCVVANEWTHEQPGYKMTCYLCNNRPRFIVITKDDVVLQGLNTQICDNVLVAASIDIIPSSLLAANVQYSIQYGMASGGCSRAEYNVVDGKVELKVADKCISPSVLQYAKCILLGYDNGWLQVKKKKEEVKKNSVVISVYTATKDLLKTPHCAVEKSFANILQGYDMSCYLCAGRPRFIAVFIETLLAQAADVQTCDSSMVPVSVDIVPNKLLDANTKFSIQYRMVSGNCIRMEYNVVDKQVDAKTASSCFTKEQMEYKRHWIKGYTTAWKLQIGNELLYGKHPFTKGS